MNRRICLNLVLLSLCVVITVYPLQAQPVMSEAALDTTTIGIGFPVGGFGHAHGGGVLTGFMVRFLPLNNWVSMDLRTDFGIGSPDEGHDHPKSFHAMFGVNGYLPLALRWNTFHKDMIARPNELKPYVSLGVGGAHFGGFRRDDYESYSADGGMEINLAFGLEFRFNRTFIFFIEPRAHALASSIVNPGRDGYVTLRFGFMWKKRTIHSKTN